jgi:hypothetical protein
MASTCLAGNWFGSGPWANSTYYPGNLDGKYQAAVSGVNTSGVLGFAIRDGAPPFLDVQTQSTSDFSDVIAVNQTIELDRSLNYYAIFVNGRTYIGTTAAAINYDNNSVTGSLLGTQPTTINNTNFNITSQLVTNTSVTGGLTNNTVETVLFTNTIVDPSVIATGVDGAFQASINSKKGVFTFQGPGQLTSPGPVVSGQQVNPQTAFNVNGIRVSFSSQATFQSVGGTSSQ